MVKTTTHRANPTIPATRKATTARTDSPPGNASASDYLAWSAGGGSCRVTEVTRASDVTTTLIFYSLLPVVTGTPSVGRNVIVESKSRLGISACLTYPLIKYSELRNVNRS